MKKLRTLENGLIQELACRPKLKIESYKVGQTALTSTEIRERNESCHRLLYLQTHKGLLYWMLHKLMTKILWPFYSFSWTKCGVYMVINLFRLVRSIELRPFTSLKDSNGERVKVIINAHQPQSRPFRHYIRFPCPRGDQARRNQGRIESATHLDIDTYAHQSSPGL